MFVSLLCAFVGYCDHLIQEV